MTRILMMDTDTALAETVGSQCLKHGIAVRFADNLCEGLHHLLDTPVSLVLLEAARVRLSSVICSSSSRRSFPAVPWSSGSMPSGQWTSRCGTSSRLPGGSGALRCAGAPGQGRTAVRCRECRDPRRRPPPSTPPVDSDHAQASTGSSSSWRPRSD